MTETTTAAAEQAALLTKAGAQLLDAVGMLRMEAEEWRDRKNSVPRYWSAGISEWAAKCDRIATNYDAATAVYSKTAKRIAELATAQR